MGTYLALLRGVNVSGQKSIRMPELRDSFLAMGCRDVQTYLQSGNIVFRSDGSHEATLAVRIQARIAQDFGHNVPVLVLSAKGLAHIADSNPLWPRTGADASLFHCTFLFEPVSAAVFVALNLPTGPDERALLLGNAILMHCPHGYGKTKLNNAFFERSLDVPATTRNWRTVLALQALCAAPYQTAGDAGPEIMPPTALNQRETD